MGGIPILYTGNCWYIRYDEMAICYYHCIIDGGAGGGSKEVEGCDMPGAGGGGVDGCDVGDLDRVLDDILYVSAIVTDVLEYCLMLWKQLTFLWPVEVLETH